MSRIHLIAVGGSVMHNLALALHEMGHQISGSDDQIYEPAKTRLLDAGILPMAEGWDDTRIDHQLDLVILGMHAKSDNPELIKAIKLGLIVQSFPEFIGNLYKNKIQIVVSGSHGKTTTTAMLMHIFKQLHLTFDYLVGAQLEGFQNMVSISEAPYAIIEGDEYLSSCLDSRSKFDHFDPYIQIITGIAWDHFNVFPTIESYYNTFSNRIKSINKSAHLVYCETDNELIKLVIPMGSHLNLHPYQAPVYNRLDKQIAIELENQWHPLLIFGTHNLENIQAVITCCKILKFDLKQVGLALQSFKGASKRMELLSQNENQIRYRDFAHSPSKVRATTRALREHFQTQKILVVVELHTYSSLSEDFISQYSNTLEAVDHAIIYFDLEALKLKNKKPLNPLFIKQAFGKESLSICSNSKTMYEELQSIQSNYEVIVFMGSGHFGGIQLQDF